MIKSKKSDGGNESSQSKEEKSLFIHRRAGLCKICGYEANFVSNFYYCSYCMDVFRNYIDDSATIFCSNNHHDNEIEKCKYCFMEFFYSNGVTIKTLKINRIFLSHRNYGSYESLSPNIMDENLSYDMENLFTSKFIDSSKEYLNWLCSRSELLCIHPVDRMTLFRRNLGRGRLMWIICETVNIHNVLKLSKCYFNPWDLTCPNLRNIYQRLFDVATYLTKGSLCKYYLDILKLLGVLQIGISIVSPSNDGDAIYRAYKYCEILIKEELGLQRPADLAIVLWHLWAMITVVDIRERRIINDLQSILFSLSQFDRDMQKRVSLGKFSWYLTSEQLADEIMKKFKIKQSICKPNPPEIIRLPVNRFYLTKIFNMLYITTIPYAEKLLKYYVDTNDQKLLLRINLTTLMIHQLALFFKMISIKNKTDKMLAVFLGKVETLHKLQKNLIYGGVTLLQLTILFIPHDDIRNNELLGELKMYFMEKLVRFVMKKTNMLYHDVKMKLLKFIQALLECSVYLEKNRRYFPLLFDFKAH